MKKSNCILPFTCFLLDPVAAAFQQAVIIAQTGKVATKQASQLFGFNNYAEDSSKRKILQYVFAGSLLSPSIAQAMYTDPATKILLPEQGEIEAAIPPVFEDNPFEGLDKTSFSRLDQTPDAIFYQDPRFTEHVDDNAVQMMAQFISNDVLRENDSVLDLCTSWTSHIDKNTVEKLNIKRVSGLGMNEEEMKQNSILNDYAVVDLNARADVKLPYEDETFNVVLCQLSIDYLIHPLEVMKEVGRVLKPGGKVVILFSNRLFIQKVRRLFQTTVVYSSVRAVILRLTVKSHLVLCCFIHRLLDCGQVKMMSTMFTLWVVT